MAATSSSPSSHSPHVHGDSSIAKLMTQVLLALIPAILLYTMLYGIGILIQIALAVSTVTLCEVVCYRWRGLNPLLPIKNQDGTVAAVLLALCIPPLSPWWLIVLGTLFTILLVKHCFGGLGCNRFNPAMAGFLFLLLSFPACFSQWPTPAASDLSLATTLGIIFLHQPVADGITGATLLGHMQTQLAQMFLMNEIRTATQFGNLGATTMEWVNMGFLLGGIYLLLSRNIYWKIPVFMLVGVLLSASVFWLWDAQHYASPLLHLFSGGTLMCAFFIATEPVSGPRIPDTYWCYGICMGIVIVVIRNLGTFPDGVAFSIILMNSIAPLFDQYYHRRHLRIFS